MKELSEVRNVTVQLIYRAGFTPSEAPVQKKIGGPYYMNTTPPPRLPSPDTHSSHHRHFLRTRAAMHTTIGLALEMNTADLTNSPPGNDGHYDSLHKIVSFIP